MSRHAFLLAGFLILPPSALTYADVSVTTEHTTEGNGFHFKAIPAPSNNDAASKATFSVIEGEPDPNGGGLAVLSDGGVPASEDEPSANFFFRAGSDGGRLRVDLRAIISIKQVCTYSWHGSMRAPQLYKLYASDGSAPGFNDAPRRDTKPESCGWKLLADVDTHPATGEPGGQYGVGIADPQAGALGRFRYLLFDIRRTEDSDAFGNTFYSEIDVVDANGPAPTTSVAPSAEPIVKTFDAGNGRYHFALDVTAAPDLLAWSEEKLKPVVQEWYPKLVAMLPSEGFEPATNITLRFRNNMGGTPAAAGGDRINLNSGWFRRELNREAIGSVVHEMVHVVQSYGRARRVNPEATRTPGWLVEGIADYIRWFLYEPQTKGAEITARNIARAKYDASYRITGNFLDWVTRHYNPDLVRKLNAAARDGKYSDQLWKELTGHTVTELGEEWKHANEERLR